MSSKSSNRIGPRLRPDPAATLATLMLLALGTASLHAAPVKKPLATASTAGRVTCTTPIQHPLIVEATALGAVERGVPLRVRVTTRAERSFDRGEVRLTSSGGAAVVGASRAVLGAVPAGGQATSEFTVVLPSEGHRFLLQFQVRGEGGSRNLTRGATLNLLPDGPAEQLRAATTGSGERLLEVRAGRIDR